MAFTASYILNLKDQFTGKAAAIVRAYKKIDQETKKNTRSAKAYAQRLHKLKKEMADTAKTSMKAGLAVGSAGMLYAANKASEFSDAMADVDKVMDLTQKGTFKRFRKTIMDLAPELATMPADLARMAYQGAKVGVADAEMKKFLVTVTKTKSAFDMTAEAAGAIIGDIKAKLNISISDTEKLMSRVNYMADTTSASGNRMLDIIARVSGDFALMKFDTKEIAAFAASADQIETSSELAASGLRMAFNRLQQSPIYRRDFQKRPVETFLGILETLKKMDPVARNLKIKKLFGDEAGKFIKKAVVNIKKFRDNLKGAASDNAIKSMDKEWQSFINRSSTGFMQIRVKLMKLVIKVGMIVLEWFNKNKKAINGIIDAFSGWIERNKTLIPIVMGLIAGLVIFVVIAKMLSIIIGALTIVVGVFGSTAMIAFLPIIAVIIAIVGVLYIMYKIWSTISGDTIQAIDDMENKVKSLVNTQNKAGQEPYVGKGVTSTYKAEMLKRNETNVNGEIVVRAEPGSQVTKKKIKANTGSNTRFMAADFGQH